MKAPLPKEAVEMVERGAERVMMAVLLGAGLGVILFLLFSEVFLCR